MISRPLTSFLHSFTSSPPHSFTILPSPSAPLTPSPLHTFLRIPLHNTVWLTLLDQVNGADPAVFQAVTLALYFLVVEDGELEGRGGGGDSRHACRPFKKVYTVTSLPPSLPFLPLSLSSLPTSLPPSLPSSLPPSLPLSLPLSPMLPESLQQLLLAKGAAMAVLEGLREFLQEPTQNEQCVEYGCRALIGLIMRK